MLRVILGAISGIAVAVLTVVLFNWVSHTVYPPPPDIDISDTAAIAEMMANAPLAALLIIVIGYVVATFDGVFLAAWIAGSKPYIYALLVGVLMLAAVISNLILIPHPLWFSITSIVGIIAAAWAAALVVPKIRGAA